MKSKRKIYVILIVALSCLLLAELISVVYLERRNGPGQEETIESETIAIETEPKEPEAEVTLPETEGTEPETSATTPQMQEESEHETVPEDDLLKTQEQIQLEQLRQRIDEGDCTGFAQLLLDGDVSDSVFRVLVQEDGAVIDYLMIDAMTAFAQEGNIEGLVLLRKNGYISDQCFLDYWEVMGCELPREGNTEIDHYLLHELKQSYFRDDYALRSFNEMRSSGLIDDAIHAALVEELGFDYSDLEYVEQNHVSPLQKLEKEEKLSYDAVLEFIDQGDCMSVVNGMLQGEITVRTYETLMENDSDVLDYVIAQGMSELVEADRFQDLVRLRLEGFVSDACFAYYWEMMGEGEPEGESASEETPGVDLYLLFELVQAYHRCGDDEALLKEIWSSGLLTDVMHEALVEQLGFDYTT